MEPNPTQRPAMSSTLQQAGLDDTPLSRPGLELAETGGLSVLRLHTLEDAAGLAARLEPAGLTLPLNTNAAAGTDPAVLCLRPGEWLLLSESAAPAALLERVRGRTDERLTTALDVSDGFGAFRLRGPAAPWLLGKVAGLDFLSGVAHGQHAARTRIGDIPVILHLRPGAADAPCFDLLADRSCAPYLWQWLAGAAEHAEELFAAHGAIA